MFTIIVALVVITIGSVLALFQFWIALAVLPVVALVILTARFVYVAKDEQETCSIPTGTIKLVEKGGSMQEGGTFVRALPNLANTGYYFDSASGTVKEGSQQGYRPFNIQGIYLVSLLYPIRQIHVFPIDYGHGFDEEPPEGKDKYTSTLKLFHTVKILVEGIELSDSTKINVLANVTFRITDPVLAVFIHGGMFITLGAASVKGVIADFGRTQTYESFTALDKEGEDSSFSQYVKKINKDAGGIEETYGITVQRVEFESHTLMDASPEVQAAINAKDIATHKAEAALIEERGKTAVAEETARRIVMLANAEADALSARIDKASSKEGGLDILKHKITAEGIQNYSSSGSLNLGGGFPFQVNPTKSTT